jgi:hypothetical protein
MRHPLASVERRTINRNGDEASENGGWEAAAAGTATGAPSAATRCARGGEIELDWCPMALGVLASRYLPDGSLAGARRGRLGEGGRWHIEDRGDPGKGKSMVYRAEIRGNKWEL